MERAFRRSLRTDAVFVFTLARRFIRPIREAPNHSAFEPWSGIGLHRHGDGAIVELAFSRPNYFRNNDFKYSDGDGLYRRRYSEGKTRRSVRPDRCGIRYWIYVRTGNWRIGWRYQSAPCVLDCSRS